MTPCTACILGKQTSNCLAGFGNPFASLAIFIDAPNQRAEQLLSWLIVSMGLTGNDVWVDYIFKCPIPSGSANPISKKEDRLPAMKTCMTKFDRPGLGAQQIVVLGNIAYEAFSDVSKVTEMQGRYDQKHQVWVGYNLLYCLMNPSEALRVWRIIYRAAELAGLKPKYRPDVPKFEFPTR